MKIGWSWLSEYCEPGMTPAELAERFSMTGTEVERLAHLGAPSDDGFVIGHVLTREKHPDADRLSVCTVDVGEEEPRTIVCGAPNVDAGQVVPVGLPGAVMPGGMKLGKAKLRGVESSGMILSETEMEAGPDKDGIAVLAQVGDEGAPAPGTPLSEILAISDPVLELEITPNRPDCFGVYGVARELHAITGNELAPEPWADDAEATGEGEVGDYASVTVEVPDLCPRFTARVFTGVTVGPSPLWLKQRLSAAGQRPINNVVDITNYVMLLTGQPLHAFDLDEVPGGEIIVRTAKEGEKMTTLDDVERSFETSDVLVCDREGPTGIAGIMGGQVSEVSDGTTRVLLEVAAWNGPNLLKTSGRLGLRSEASTRFEKQIHPELTLRAQRVASKLMVELCGAKLVPGTIDVDAGMYGLGSLELRAERMRALLGMDVPDELATEYLERLGLGVTGGDGTLTVSITADRHFDLTREVDLIEEVGRVHGVDENLPTTLPSRPPGAGKLSPHQQTLRRAENLLRDVGLSEAITWSFVAPDAREKLGIERGPAVVVHNPLSEDQSVMRTNLIGGLIGSATFNVARGAGRVALFESGRVYLAEPTGKKGGVLDGSFSGNRPTPAREPHRIAAIVVGSLGLSNWQGPAPAADFYAAKGLVELLCSALKADLELREGTQPFLHPARSAELLIGGELAGWVGELHPRIAEQADLPGGVAFELDAGKLHEASGLGAEIYEDVVSFPPVTEDLSFELPVATTAESAVDCIRGAGGELLRSAEVFDVYEGEQVGEGMRSLAIRLEFRAPDRTLTDEEVSSVRAEIIDAVAKIGGTQRG